MSENIGIEAIAPDEKVEIDNVSSSKIKKREKMRKVKMDRSPLIENRKERGPLRHKSTNTTEKVPEPTFSRERTPAMGFAKRR